MDINLDNPFVLAVAAIAILVLGAVIIGQIRVGLLRWRWRGHEEEAPKCVECGSVRFRRGALTSIGYRFTCQGPDCGTIWAFVPGVGIVDKIVERPRRR